MEGKSVFLHIPKTAGSTLREVFRKNHQNKFLLIPGNNPIEGLKKAYSNGLLKSSELVWLHGDYGCFKPENDFYTMLREPIARMESFYFYVKSQPNHYLYEFSQNRNAISFFEQAETLETRNGQSRIIAGCGGFHGIHASKQGIDENELLSLAKSNLFNNFKAFGLQSSFFESLVVFEKALKWQKGIDYVSLNKRAESFKDSRFTKKEIQCIKELNCIDLEIYDEATDIFNMRLNRMYLNFRRAKYYLFKA